MKELELTHEELEGQWFFGVAHKNKERISHPN
jgi:hypothetical protein